MKHLDDYKIFENNKFPNSKEDVICRIYDIRNYTINDDVSIDVNGDVNLRGQHLWELPLRFNRVSGYFDCSNNNLISLKVCPKYISEYFCCSNNNITSLEGCPEHVAGDFYLFFHPDEETKTSYR